MSAPRDINKSFNTPPRRTLVVAKHSYKPAVSRRKSWWTEFAASDSRDGFAAAWRARHLEVETAEAERRAFQKSNPGIGYWKTDQP